MNSCLSGISLGTVSPYSRRPSPRKKSQVSTISCTSPRASASGLPTSRVTRRASASALSATIRPIAAITWPRTGAGTAAQAGWAARAAAQARDEPVRRGQLDAGHHVGQVGRVDRVERAGGRRRYAGRQSGRHCLHAEILVTIVVSDRSVTSPLGWGVFAFTQAISATSALLRIWPGWGFGGRQARGVIRDWGYTARHGRFPRLAGVELDRALAAVRTPVLAMSVDDDQYTPAPTLDHLAAKFLAAPVERVHYTSAEAGAPLDHFIWVRAAGPLAARIARFAGVGTAARPSAETRGG